MNVDYLIIGQGLAGSLLAWELMQRGCKVLVVDNGIQSASQVAAGLINPVTGMRLVKTQGVDFLLPAAKKVYSKLAAYFGQDFYIEKPMLRLFASENEWQQCQKRVTNPDYQNYLDACYKTHGVLETPFGYAVQKQTGYLLTRPLLAALKAFFIANGSYRQVVFNALDIELAPCLRWQNISPRKIIFCQGYQDAQNPWFNGLPFQPVKGEILTLEHSIQLTDDILNFGHWLIPLSSNQCRVGATFDHKNLTTEATEQGKTELLQACKRISNALSLATVTQHQAHVRPCTLDKQPFIGCHPEHSGLAIFNGFGAKGSLQIPWYSQHFADRLLNNSPLSPDCNILRAL